MISPQYVDGLELRIKEFEAKLSHYAELERISRLINEKGHIQPVTLENMLYETIAALDAEKGE